MLFTEIMPKRSNAAESKEVLTDRNAKAVNAHALSDHPTTLVRCYSKFIIRHFPNNLLDF